MVRVAVRIDDGVWRRCRARAIEQGDHVGDVIGGLLTRWIESGESAVQAMRPKVEKPVPPVPSTEGPKGEPKPKPVVEAKVGCIKCGCPDPRFIELATCTAHGCYCHGGGAEGAKKR